jgi:hypothetical protein
MKREENGAKRALYTPELQAARPWVSLAAVQPLKAAISSFPAKPVSWIDA